MGNTTVIELNHDRAKEIDDHPERFMKQIKEQLNCAEHTGQYIVGGRIIAFFHRSGPIEQAWEKWKKKWGAR